MKVTYSESETNQNKQSKKKDIKKIAKKVLSKSYKKYIIIIAIVVIVIVLLASIVKLIFHIDTAGEGSGDDKTKAVVPAAFQDVTQSVGVVTGAKTTSSSAGATSGNTNSSSSSNGGIAQNIIDAAVKCHEYVRTNGYTYGGGYSIPDGIYSNKVIDCSAYVSWVMYTAGYDSFKGHQELDFVGNASSHGLVEVPLSEVQPGDIIHEPGHVEIVAEVVNGTITRVYNCGDKTSIQSQGTSELPESSADGGGADHALRPSNVAGSTHNIQSGNSSNSIAQATSNVSKHIVSNGRGGYKIDIDLDKKIDEVIEKLDKEGNNPLNNYLSDKNRKEYLKEFLRASIVTCYPDLREKSEIGKAVPEGEVQGIIRIRRKTENTKEGEKGGYLEYIPEDDYNKLKQKNDYKEISGYFTIDSNGQIVVAGYEQRTVEPQKEDKGKDPRPDEIKNNAEEPMKTITDARINYIQQVEKYSMPFDLLWSLLVYSSDEDFTYELAKLVNNGQIEITVCDNITIKEKTDVYTYNKNVKIEEHATIEDITQTPPKAETKKYQENRPDEKYKYTITNKSTYTSNTPSIDITYADTWIMKYKADVEKAESKRTDTTENKEEDDKKFKEDGEEQLKESNSQFIGKWKKDYEDYLKQIYKQEIDSREKRINSQKEAKANAKTQVEKYLKEQLQTKNQTQTQTNNQTKTTVSEKDYNNAREVLSQEDLKSFEVMYRVSELKLKYFKKLTDKTRKITTVTTEKKYRVKPGKTEGKVDPKDKDGNFVKLLKEHDKAYGSLKSIKDWLFESMEAQESICDMVDLIKYLFQKTYNIDLGVENFSFEEYGVNRMNNSVYGGDDGETLVHWLCSFENENLWDYLYGNGTYDDYVSKYITKDKKYYKMRADEGNTVAYNRNFGFGVCFYSNGTFMHVNSFKKYGIDITDAKFQQDGAELDVEIVNKVRDEEIRSAADSIRQRAAKEGVTLDDAQIAVLIDITYQWGNIGNFFEVYKAAGQDRNNNAIRNFQAYDNYGNLGGHPLDGEEYVNRENCRWKLFSQGIYVTNNGKTLTPKTTSSGSNAGNTTHATSSTGEGGYSQIVKDNLSQKTYKVYNQGAYGGSIPSSGCSISSEAIILSGYRPELKYSPSDMASYCGNDFPRTLHQIASDLTSLNVQSTAYSVPGRASESTIQEGIRNIRNNLNDGKPVIILVRGNKYTSQAHYMAVIGFNGQGKPVIADPNGGRIWEEDSLEDLVRYHVYDESPSNSELGYVLINKK